MTEASLEPWARWTRSSWGIASRVFLGIAGVGVGAALVFVGFSLIGLWVFTAPLAMGLFGLEFEFPAEWIVVFAISGLLVGIASIAAAIRPTKVMVAIALIGLLGGLVVLTSLFT